MFGIMSSKKSKLSDRLDEARSALGHSTEAEFADSLGIRRQTFNAYATMKREPRSVNLELLSKISDCGIDLRWLLTGDGEPFQEGKAPQPEGPRKINVVVSDLSEEIDKLEADLRKYQEAFAGLTPDQLARVPGESLQLLQDVVLAVIGQGEGVSLRELFETTLARIDRTGTHDS